jgi:hypothetical protein
MTFAARVVSLLALALLPSACGGSSDGEGSGRPSASSTASSPPSPTVQVLELGKSDLALEAGTVASPAGFEPALTFEVPHGWASVHRYADSFDVGVPDPASDGPLVVVTFSLAPEPAPARRWSWACCWPRTPGPRSSAWPTPSSTA